MSLVVCWLLNDHTTHSHTPRSDGRGWRSAKQRRRCHSRRRVCVSKVAAAKISPWLDAILPSRGSLEGDLAIHPYRYQVRTREIEAHAIKIDCESEGTVGTNERRIVIRSRDTCTCVAIRM